MILAMGKLVEVETNERGFRTAHLLNGRYVDSFSVSQRLNGEVDALVGQNVVCQCRKYTNWIEVGGKRRPSDSVSIVAIRAETPDDHELAAAA
jgi:hypothetical protein